MTPCSQAQTDDQALGFSREVTSLGNKSCRSLGAVNGNLVKALRDLPEDAPALGFSIAQEPPDPIRSSCTCV